MTNVLLHDLAPQFALNRAYWMGWNSGGDPDSDLPIYRSGIPHALLNGVTRVRNRPIEGAVAEARERLLGVRWVWWVGGDSDPGTADALLALGAKPAGEVPVMARDLVGEPEPEPEPVAVDGLSIIRPDDDLHGYVRAYAAPHGIPDGAVDLAVLRERAYRAPSGTLVRLAGRVDGRIVATTSILLDGEMGGLFCVGTLDEYRRRGIAYALTVEALRIARDAGCRVVTLQASSLGEPVYRRAGFRAVDRYRFFTL